MTNNEALAIISDLVYAHFSAIREEALATLIEAIDNLPPEEGLCYGCDEKTCEGCSYPHYIP